jgi:hypothetical protein
VRVNIPDLPKLVSFSIGRGTFAGVPDLSVRDLTLSLQALNFCFANPDGFQMLGVSARMRLREVQAATALDDASGQKPKDRRQSTIAR